MTDLGTLLLRNPAQTSAFGHILDGECGQAFTDATIAAESGSGKSFLANYLITSYLSLGAQVFVIDVGKSYQNLCELLGGSFIFFKPRYAVRAPGMWRAR